MRWQVPGTQGIELRVLGGGIVSGMTRALVECPFEYSKVKRQTGQQWVLRDVFKGFSMVVPRANLMMTTYFVQIDSYRRHTSVLSTKLGQFTASGSAAMIAFWVIWPLEVLKNIAQAET